MRKKKALITGITGQDGSYLAEFLLEKGYEVYGLRRAVSNFNSQRIGHLLKLSKKKSNKLHLVYGDLTESGDLNRVIESIRPDEVYNLGAQSHVHLSFQLPEYTAQINALGVLRILDAIKNVSPKTKFYQASTSELFGKVQENPQNEKTPFYPRSPYGVAKLYAHWITLNYRESHNIFACAGILFNHESPRRGEDFVTRKITIAAAKISLGLQKKLYLGNLNAKRDWGYAKDYVEAMWLMLQQKEPSDFVISSGETHTVREFCEKAFKHAGIKLEWRGKGVKEKGINKATGKVVVEIDPKYFRPSEVDLLLGDSTKARKVLGWKPKTGFDELIKIMVEADLKEFEKKQ